MKILRKISALLLLFVLFTSFTGCSCKNTKPDEGKNDTVLKNDEPYTLIIKDIKKSSGFFNTDFTGELTISKADGHKGLCSVEGSACDNVSVCTDEANKTIIIKGNGEIRQDSVKIQINADIKELRIDNCNLNLHIDFGKSKDIKLNMSGAFNGSINMDAETLFAQLDGACNLTFSGNAEKAEIETNGAAVLNSESLLAKSVIFTARGASSCSIYASENLEASVYDACSIVYSGDPKNVTKTIEGAGTIKAK